MLAAKRWWFALPVSLAAACGADDRGPQSGDASLSAQAKEPPAGEAVDHAGLRAAYVAAVQKDASPAYRLERGAKGAISARNPAQGLSAELSAAGVRVAVDARADRPFELSLDAVGCEGDLAPAAAASPEASGNRAEYRRGDVVEWYLNGPLGLEQGFDLATRPACREDGGGAVTLSMRAEGLLPELTAEADAALLRDEAGEVILRYTDLYVTDAQGRVLPSFLSAEEGRLSIHVDDTGAIYPIVVDPIVWSETQKLLANDAAADDAFGYAVAIDGDTAVIGAPDDDDAVKGVDAGSAYVFLRNAANNTWTQSQRLLSNDASLTAGDRFGRAVTISGNIIAVGAPIDNASRGVVFVYQRTAFGSNFAYLQKITAADAASGDRFGSSVALSGTTLVVGAPFDDTTPNTDSGSAYVYLKGATTFAAQGGKLTAGAAAATQDEFGTSVAISGDTIVVGAYGDDDNGSVSGSAFVFFRTAGTWAQQAKLAPPDGKANDWFGYSVAVAGDTALIAAPFALASQGKAYAYTRTGGVWAQQAQILAMDGDGGDQFGYSVSLVGDTAVIGARYDDPQSTGSAYVFLRTGGVWAQEKKLTGSDAGLGDQFGHAVGVSGSWAIVGSESHDGPAANTGAAYMFTPQNKLDIGQACQVGKDCASGFCADGVCCNTACGGSAAGDCQACNLAGAIGTCTPSAAGTECRMAGGACDVAEMCDGTNTACPADTKVAAGTECRASIGGCDPAEACDGASNDCPADMFAAGGSVCRAAVGACDVDEICDGFTPLCPGDNLVPAGTECRAAAGGCDVAEKCDGANGACPADAKVAAGSECRAAAGACDAAEACDGASSDCPADMLSSAGTECRAAAGLCDAPESCDGATVDCPTDAFAVAGAECRAAAGECDVAEVCDGATSDCPTDGLVPDGTSCTDGTCQVGVCETGEGGAGGGGGAGGAGGDGGRGGAGGSGASGSTGTGGGPVVDDGGCDCRAAGSTRGDAGSAGIVGLALGLAAFVRRLRSRRVGV
ncbi:hypothetical protein [Polyangium sp. 6x1]|uniref:hypothetical protein n=1 Tax=Polyangium sp. 6x1 TaxID=3042689 RepID=UPI0024821E3D|nr:hypothetical protein [Polyangium sp. 6x1]MDI1446786.1 hypothetical protein [Polyangium sp. 6x1]